jgi:hypothetical protein
MNHESVLACKRGIIHGDLAAITTMPIKKKPRGAPPGTINNPDGKNHHAGDRGQTIAFRLPIDLDEKFRTQVEELGTNKTAAMIEAVGLWLEKQTENCTD